MPAKIAYNAYMKRRHKIQYTIRNIPESLDKAVRRIAKKQGKSLNQIAINALKKEAGFEEDFQYNDLDWISGTWEQDREFDKVIKEIRNIDKEMWK